MVTGERGQRAAAMMVGEVESETADAAKRFCLELRDAAENHLRQGEGVCGPLNRDPGSCPNAKRARLGSQRAKWKMGRCFWNGWGDPTKYRG